MICKIQGGLLSYRWINTQIQDLQMDRLKDLQMDRLKDLQMDILKDLQIDRLKDIKLEIVRLKDICMYR